MLSDIETLTSVAPIKCIDEASTVPIDLSLLILVRDCTTLGTLGALSRGSRIRIDNTRIFP